MFKAFEEKFGPPKEFRRDRLYSVARWSWGELRRSPGFWSMDILGIFNVNSLNYYITPEYTATTIRWLQPMVDKKRRRDEFFERHVNMLFKPDEISGGNILHQNKKTILGAPKYFSNSLVILRENKTHIYHIETYVAVRVSRDGTVYRLKWNGSDIWKGDIQRPLDKYGSSWDTIASHMGSFRDIKYKVFGLRRPTKKWWQFWK